MKRTQRGMTLIGFILVLAVAGIFVFLGMKVIPMYQEFFSVKSALKSLAAEPDIADTDPAKIQDLFFRRLYVSYAEDVKPDNVKIKRVDAGWQMDVDYEMRKDLIYNLDIVGKFHATQLMTRHGTTG